MCNLEMYCYYYTDPDKNPNCTEQISHARHEICFTDKLFAICRSYVRKSLEILL